MLNRLLFTLAFCFGLGYAAPFQHSPTDLAGRSQPVVVPRAVNSSSCPGYKASNLKASDSTLTADLTLAGDACNIYSDDIRDLKLLVEYQNDDRIHIKIYDAALQVYQVPQSIISRDNSASSSAAGNPLLFYYVEQPFSFKVKRKSNGEVLFDTSAAALIFETQYVHLRTYLPQDPNIYGIGEHSDSFRFHTNGYERVLLNAESPGIPENSNLYGTHPIYFDHRGDKGTHGVFLLNSSPMQVDLNKDASGRQYLEYNTVGGILDFYFLSGSEPAQVSKQYADVVGYPAMFPYWSFGFQQCKYGYFDVNMVAEVVANYSTAGIPLEVMWTDIDYMDLRQDFTTDPDRFPLSKMRELISTLHSRDQRYVLILDPGIHAVGNYTPYENGHEKNVFLKHADGTDLLGGQWPGAVVWPDWFAPNTQQWWTDEIQATFNPDTGIDLDGLWVDMNEGSNFCEDQNCNPRQQAITDGNPPKPAHPPRPNTGRPIPGFPADFQPSPNTSLARRQSNDNATGDMKGLPDRDWFYPKYHINSHRGDLSQYTIWTNTSNYDGTWQYDTHNFYGHMMATTTRESLLARRPALRPFVLTRSTFAGSGHKVAHWFGDNASRWEHYRTSIRQMLAFVSMHQMPMVGSDVCGFNENADKFMCARWAMLGAFQPFYRNHAELSTIQQEFYQWPITTAAAKKAIDTRYKLLDYIYTALYYQTTTGAPMINPLFFKYPSDPATFGLQEQWFYGDSLLISPVTQDYSDTVTLYLPKDTFYDYWTYARVDGAGANITLSNLTFTDIPVHIRGGSIIPQRIASGNTTKAVRKQDFSIIVAPGADGKASGRLYLDDGESLVQRSISEVSFAYDNGKFSATGSFGYEASGEKEESVTVKEVLVLGQGKAGDMGSFDQASQTVTVQGPWVLDGEWEFSI